MNSRSTSGINSRWLRAFLGPNHFYYSLLGKMKLIPSLGASHQHYTRHLTQHIQFQLRFVKTHESKPSGRELSPVEELCSDLSHICTLVARNLLSRPPRGSQSDRHDLRYGLTLSTRSLFPYSTLEYISFSSRIAVPAATLCSWIRERRRFIAESLALSRRRRHERKTCCSRCHTPIAQRVRKTRRQKIKPNTALIF